MDRYSDNSSPEPNPASGPTLVASCFKTPDFQQFHDAIPQYAGLVGQFYPTPPSDNEDSSSLPSQTHIQTAFGVSHHLPNTTPLSVNSMLNSRKRLFGHVLRLDRFFHSDSF